MITLFITINKVGLGRGAVLFNLTAVFATFAAIPLLKEWPRPASWGALGLATAGVSACSASGIPVGREWLALLAALSGGLTYPFIRQLRQTDNNQVAFFSQCAFGLPMILPLLSWSQFPVTPDVWGLILAMIGCAIDGQLILSHGLASVKMAKGAVILLLIPVLSLLTGVLLFAERLSARQWWGCALVLSAAILSVLLRPPKPQVGHHAGSKTSETLLPS